MIVRCAWEKLDKLFAEPNFPEMIRAYSDELNQIEAVAPYSVDWAELRRLEAAGRYRVWVCRVDGTLAGFITCHIMAHLFHKDTLWAFDNGHYLAPQYRDIARIAWRMWRTLAPALRALGVTVHMAHDNASRPLTPFFLGLGYEPRSTIYLKVL